MFIELRVFGVPRSRRLGGADNRFGNASLIGDCLFLDELSKAFLRADFFTGGC